MTLPDTPGLRLLSSALAFCRAAELLHEDAFGSLAWAPCFVNLGLAIELGLKGFLRENGMSEAQQKAFQHDLVCTFKAALARGFNPPHVLLEALVNEINPHYKDMSLRYQIGTSVNLPPLEDAIVATRLLLHTLYIQCTTKYRPGGVNAVVP
ncbi:MAG: hypothetical protein ACREFK_17245 [Stellaceae bacterium]